MSQQRKSNSPLVDALKIFARNKPALIAFLMLTLLATSAATGAAWTGKRADAGERVRMEEANLLGDNYKTEAVDGAVLDPVSPELKDTFLPPLSKSEAHPDKFYWLGTDHLGRDVLARVWAGSTISLIIGFLAVGISIVLGISLGGIAGYFGRSRVGLIVIATLLFLLAWGILLAAGLPIPAWICLVVGLALLITQLVIAIIGARWKTVTFFFASVALFISFSAYNHHIETTTPEGQTYTEAAETHRQAYDELLAIRDYGRDVKTWEESAPENLSNLNEGKDIPEWLYAGQLKVEIGTRLLELQVARLHSATYNTENQENLRLARDQQDRADHLEQFIDEYAARNKEAAANEADAMAERDRLFKEDRRDEGRAMAERAAEYAIRKKTFDPEALKARIAKSRASGEADEAYYSRVIDAAVEPMQDRTKAIDDAVEALRKILDDGATGDESLRERQFEAEEVLRNWKQAAAQFDLADAVLRTAAANEAIDQRKADVAADDPGLADLQKQLAAAEAAKGEAEKAVAAAKKDLEALAGIRKEKNADVAAKQLAPWTVQGSSGLVDRRGKLRKAYVIKYETAMRNGFTALHVAEELNGSYRYSFYRFTSHFLTTTVLYLLLVIATLALMAASQAVVTDRLKGLRLAYLPTISVDDLVMRFTEIMLTIPVIFLILAILAIFEKDVYITMGVIGLTSWMGTTRFVRAEILSLREQDFVQSAQALGLSDFRIIWRHLVPNAISPVLVSATLGVAGAVLAESTLSFLGIGAKADQTTWGLILSEGREYIFDAPWLTWIPGLAILITVLSFNLLGEGLREAFNPKLRGR